MKCESCDKKIVDESLFCNFCGRKQSKTVQAQYTHPYGYWEVTTEGDCEGRTVKNLGVHHGYVDDIARKLAPQVEYVLKFRSVPNIEVIPGSGPKEVEVNISFDYESGYISSSDTERMYDFAKLFENRPVHVERSSYSGAVKLVFRPSL